jgi:hypothetical protein
MNCKTLIAALLIPLSAAGTAAAAEGNIRQGKNLDYIEGKVGGGLAFTIEGESSDIAIMRLADGSVLFWGTLQELNKGISHGPGEKLPIGATGPNQNTKPRAMTVDFKFAAVSAGFHKSFIEVYRAGRLLDEDPILIY